MTNKKNSDENGFSEKIENAFEGSFNFAIRFLVTICILTFKPWKTPKSEDKSSISFKARPIRPLTYFVLSAFVFSILIGAMGGVTATEVIASSVFVTEEFAKQLIQRISDGISISDMLLGAIPAILVVIAFSRIVGYLAFNTGERIRQFSDVALYAFGTQIALYMVAIAYASVDLIEQHHNSLGLAWWFNSSIGRTASWLLFWGPLTLAFLAPFTIVFFGTKEIITKRNRAINFLKRIILLPITALIPVAYFYTLTIPPRIQNSLKEKNTEEQEIVQIQTTDQGKLSFNDTASIQLEIAVSLENETNSLIIVDKSGWNASLIDAELYQPTDEDPFNSKNLQIKSVRVIDQRTLNGEFSSTLAISPRSAIALKLFIAIELINNLDKSFVEHIISEFGNNNIDSLGGANLTIILTTEFGDTYELNEEFIEFVL